MSVPWFQTKITVASQEILCYKSLFPNSETFLWKKTYIFLHDQVTTSLKTDVETSIKSRTESANKCGRGGGMEATSQHRPEHSSRALVRTGCCCGNNHPTSFSGPALPIQPLRPHLSCDVWSPRGATTFKWQRAFLGLQLGTCPSRGWGKLKWRGFGKFNGTANDLTSNCKQLVILKICSNMFRNVYYILSRLFVGSLW